MPRTTITRRRALALGAAAGLGSLASSLPAAPAYGRRRTRARGFGLDVTSTDFRDDGVSRVLRAPRRFDLLGVRGPGAPGLDVRVRRRGGAWSPWVALAVHGDHAPDTGTGQRASDPVWSGGSHELQLRAARAPREALRVHLVAVPGAAGRRIGARAAAAAAQRPSQAVPGTPPPILPRASWGADAVPPRADPDVGEVQLAFVHHTVTANGYAPADTPAIVLGIAKYHRDTNGWNDIGYNFVVDQYGQVFEGRAGGVEQAIVGAQAQGYNRVSTGVAVLGSHGVAPVSDAALAAIGQLLGWKLSLHGVPAVGQVTVSSAGGDVNRFAKDALVTFERISGHRDGDRTSCPGDALYAQLPDLRRRAAALAGPVARHGQVTLQAGAAAVAYGAQASFSGTVIRPDSTAGAGERVAVQKRGRTGRWVTIARATAGSDGAWTTAVGWRSGGAVRAQAAGVVSKAVRLDVVPIIEARRVVRRVAAGGTVLVAGRVRPAVGVQVVVERRGADGRYRRVAFVRAGVRRTAFRTRVRLRRPGLYRLTPRTSAGPAAPLFVRAVRRRVRTGGVTTRG